MRVAVHPSFPNFDPAAHCADLGIDFTTTADLGEIAELARVSDALIINGPLYSKSLAETIARPGSRLRFIQLLSAGYETVQTFGAPPDVMLSNGSDIWAPAVAEHAVALLLGLLRRFPQLERRRLTRSWDREKQLAELGSLDGARVAILGYGTIGQEIAKRLKPFGAEVIGVARAAKPCPHAARVAPLSELTALLPSLQALINVVPGGPGTVKMVDAAMLSRLRSDAVLVNVGRGTTMDEAALFTHLKEGRIAGAGLDVFETEPLPADSPLWSLDNVLLSPHSAGFGSAGPMRRAHELCRENLINLRDGTKLRSQIVL
jgi:phosphoglycerate dehydrogenase-like enzyme